MHGTNRDIGALSEPPWAEDVGERGGRRKNREDLLFTDPAVRIPAAGFAWQDASTMRVVSVIPFVPSGPLVCFPA